MDWYEQDVKRLEEEALNLKYKPEMVFYGSSSITMWSTLYEDFAAYKPVNLGFGGSTLEACVYYFNRIMKPYDPNSIVIYAGDNDLGDGKQPKQVLDFFEQLCKLIADKYNKATVFYISVKPSLTRWNINKQIRETNELIKQSIETKHAQMQFINIYNSMLNEKGKPNAELYVEDGLHLSSKGYTVWKEILLTHFSSNIHVK